MVKRASNMPFAVFHKPLFSVQNSKNNHIKAFNNLNVGMNIDV